MRGGVTGYHHYWGEIITTLADWKFETFSFSTQLLLGWSLLYDVVSFYSITGNRIKAVASGIWIISLHEWTNNYITQICRIFPPPLYGPDDTSVKNMFTEIFWYETRAINTHHHQHWPCEHLRFSRVIQQNPRSGNRWSIFNIRMKIIKMFTMEINILLVRKSISAGRAKFKWPVMALVQRACGETEQFRAQSGDRL